MNKIVFKAKERTAISGRKFIALPKTITRAHFIGTHKLENTDIFLQVVKRELIKSLDCKTMIYLDAIPKNVSIKGDYMKTIEVAL